MRLTLLFTLHLLAPPALAEEGLWLTARKDPRNQARADVPGKMTTAPREVWRRATGGSVRFAQEVTVGDERAFLLQVGSNLELRRASGETVWRQCRLGVGAVLRVDDFGAGGDLEALVTTDVQTAVLLDVGTGETLWSWQSGPSTQIIGHAFQRTPAGLRFICFPSYADKGYCFDFSGNRSKPKLLWQQSYAGKYGVGYGPNLVLCDMDGEGGEEIVLSGKVPSVYHAVIDPDTGALKFDVHYDIGGWGRPYGLLVAEDLDADGKPEIIMVSCQVEEYLAVARNVGGQKLEKIWGHFVEKDWPQDHKELRPQVTSVADLQGNGRPELVVGLWEEGQWHTIVLDPLKGFDSQRGRLAGYYFWGCHDLTGDGRPEIIVSTESKRQPARVTTLAALDGKTFESLGSLEEAAVLTSSDSPVPPNTYFMAVRSNPVFARTADGLAGILVRRFSAGSEVGTALWGGKAGWPLVTRAVSGPGCTRVDLHDNRLLLSDAAGKLQRFDETLTPVGESLATHGRTCVPLVWSVGDRRELVVDEAGGTIVGGTPEAGNEGRLQGEWRVQGRLPALHVDAAGTPRLAAMESADPTDSAALVYTGPLTSGAQPLRIPLPYPVFDRGGLLPYGDAKFSLLACLQTGVHTLALASYDSQGRLQWQDSGRGVYPKVAGAADLDGDGTFEVLADDHGNFRIYDDSGKAIATNAGWPPAYTVPIVGPFLPGGGLGILRASGINGLDLLDLTAKSRWLTKCAVWKHYRSTAAVGNVSSDGTLHLGSLAEDGTLECIDLASGKLRWSLPLSAAPNGTSIVAGDLDGDGGDEFLVGLPDGNLVAVEESDGQGRILWQKEFPAAVANPIVADLDGDGLAEILLSTSDGYVRLLEE